MEVKSTNQITLVDLTDAYSIFMSSEAYTFNGNENGAPSGLSCSTQITAYCGRDLCRTVNISSVKCPTGITYKVTDNNTMTPTITFTTTAVVKDSCEATIAVVVNDININKKFSFAIAKKGTSGKGVLDTIVTYQAGTSGTVHPSGVWSETIPVVPQGQYLWSRTMIIYTDQTSSTSYSVAYIPANGQDGRPGSVGTGIANITQEYYLSNSKTSQTGSSWGITMPTWTSGKYLWTRYRITYKNPTSTAYTTPVCDSSWEAVNEIQVGGRNLLIGTRDITGDLYIPSAHGSIDDSVTYNGLAACRTNRPWTGPAFDIAKIVKRSGLKVGDVCTIQAMVMPNFNDLGNFSFSVVRINGNSNSISPIKLESNKWHKISATITLDEKSITDGTLTNTRIECNNYDSSLLGPDGKPTYIFGEGKYLWMAGYKLEIGNKATDWTPAPEDVDEEIKNVRADLKVTEDSITGKVSSVENQLIGRIEEASTEFKQYADGIDINIVKKVTESEEWNSLKSSISATAEDLTIDLSKKINDVDNALKNFENEYHTYFKFTDKGLEISNHDPTVKSKLATLLGNDRLSFTQDGQEVAYISNNKLFIKEAWVESTLSIKTNYNNKRVNQYVDENGLYCMQIMEDR